MGISKILVIAALVCFVIAAAGIPTGRFNAVGAGLALWVLSTLV